MPTATTEDTMTNTKRFYRLRADYGWNVDQEEREANTPDHPQIVAIEATSWDAAFARAHQLHPNVPNWKE